MLKAYVIHTTFLKSQKQKIMEQKHEEQEQQHTLPAPCPFFAARSCCLVFSQGVVSVYGFLADAF